MATVKLKNEVIKQAAWDDWMANGAPALRKLAQAEAPIDKGGLKGGINFRKTKKREARLESSARYSKFVTFGHGVIVPKKPGGVLRWLDKLTGKPVFARRVGPLAGNNFLLRGCRKFGLRIVSSGRQGTGVN